MKIDSNWIFGYSIKYNFLFFYNNYTVDEESGKKILGKKLRWTVVKSENKPNEWKKYNNKRWKIRLIKLMVIDF